MKSILAITLMLLVLSGCGSTRVNLSATVPQGHNVDITVTTTSSEATE